MNGGTLKQKVKFIRYDHESDGSGGQISTSVEVLETWAKVNSVKSVKTLEALQKGLNSAYLVNIRMRKDFEPKPHYDIEYKGINHAILTIESDEIDSKEWNITMTKRES